MANSVNARVALAISTLFGSETDADCEIVFYKEDNSRSQSKAQLEDDVTGPPAKKRKISASQVASAGLTTYGSPLPAHRILLRCASDRFKAQFERWAEGAEQSATPCQPSTGPKPRPVLRVPLGSEAEVPAARAAIRFAYTGQVDAGSIREALEVRRQGAYLQIEGCAAACDEVIKARLKAESSKLETHSTTHSVTSAQASGGGRTSTCSLGFEVKAPQPAVLELYACGDLWPDPSSEAGFLAVLTMAKPLLVRCFGDTLAALNTPLLRQQLLALPAVAVEALLESDDFGTDCESSVFLLLATWMEANYDKADATTRQMLCHHIRLVQLSRPYVLQILPALALHHHLDPHGPSGWFPIPFPVANHVAVMATATPVERKAHDDFDHRLPWYNTTPRRQCLTPAGRVYNWFISHQDLQRALDGSEADSSSAASNMESASAGDNRASSSTGVLIETSQDGCSSAANHCLASDTDNCDIVEVYDSFFEGSVAFLMVGGFLWRAKLECKRGEPSAGLFLVCILPSALRLGTPPQDSYLASAIATIDAFLAVHTWETRGRMESRRSLRRRFLSTEAFVDVGRGLGWPSMLPLRQSTAQQGEAGTGGGPGVSLAAWSDYLRKGKMTGTLTLLPPTLAS